MIVIYLATLQNIDLQIWFYEKYERNKTKTLKENRKQLFVNIQMLGLSVRSVRLQF